MKGMETERPATPEETAMHIRNLERYAASLRRDRDRHKIRAAMLDTAIARHELNRLSTFMGPNRSDRKLYATRQKAFDACSATEAGCVDCGQPMRGDVLKECQNPECAMYGGRVEEKGESAK